MSCLGAMRTASFLAMMGTTACNKMHLVKSGVLVIYSKTTQIDTDIQVDTKSRRRWLTWWGVLLGWCMVSTNTNHSYSMGTIHMSCKSLINKKPWKTWLSGSFSHKKFFPQMVLEISIWATKKIFYFPLNPACRIGFFFQGLYNLIPKPKTMIPA